MPKRCADKNVYKLYKEIICLISLVFYYVSLIKIFLYYVLRVVAFSQFESAKNKYISGELTVRQAAEFCGMNYSTFTENLRIFV